MKKLLAQISISSAGQTAVGLVGSGLISYGFWEVYEPAGFVVAGALLLAGALFSGGK